MPAERKGLVADAQGSNRLPTLAAELAVAHRDSLAAGRTAIEKAISAGVVLREAKSLCRHGEWLPFLAAAGVHERTAQRYMGLANSGLESDTVSDLGGIRAALSFVERWRLPNFDDALFISDPDRQAGDQSVGRGVAFVWEDEHHRGYFHVAAIDNRADGEECFITRRPMRPTIEVPDDRPVNTIVGFLLSQGFALPIAAWGISTVSRGVVLPVVLPFWTDNTVREHA